MALREWHRPGIKPNIGHFRSSVHFSAAFFAADFNIVYIWLMQIKFAFRIQRQIPGHNLSDLSGIYIVAFLAKLALQYFGIIQAVKRGFQNP